jgi:4,5-DOPA dioxygenase extradiol
MSKLSFVFARALGPLQRLPGLIFLSHGAPPLADDRVWTPELADWSAGIPRPQAVLVVSAHWEEAPLALGATTTVPLSKRSVQFD